MKTCEIIAVLDVQQGLVVRGVAGERERYRPIQSQLTSSTQPSDVAEAIVTAYGLRTFYIADLDAIAGQPANVGAYREVARHAEHVLIDAGVGTLDELDTLHVWCADVTARLSLVVGLESLRSRQDLRAMAVNYANDLVFSLDLKQGVPLCRASAWSGLSALEIAERAVAAGVRRMIVLDLADVGTGGGTRTLELIEQLRQRSPHLQIIAGGGVRNVFDLERLAAVGCAGALVASALHDRRLSRQEIERFSRPL